MKTWLGPDRDWLDNSLFYQCVSQQEMQRVSPNSHEPLMSEEKCGGEGLDS